MGREGQALKRTLGTALTVRLNPLWSRLLLASQKMSSICALVCPSTQLGHYSKDRQPLTSGPALPLFLLSFPVFFFGGRVLNGTVSLGEKRGALRVLCVHPTLCTSLFLHPSCTTWDGCALRPASGMEVFGGPERQEQVGPALEG